ncbi:MAG: N-glycosylase/DNA lyase [Desulfurococcaceae archaeon]
MIINTERVNLIASKLKEIKPYLEHLKALDPQYKAVKTLVELRGSNIASLLSILNALISYQLCSPGEEYWLNFSSYFSNSNITISESSFRDFLLSIECTKSLDQKTRRVGKILSSHISKKLLEQGDIYCSNINTLIDELAGILKANKDSKTIVFAAKMYSYFCETVRSNAVYHYVKIPIDYRNSLLTLTSCMVSIPFKKDLKECARELTRSPHAKTLQALWGRICEISGIQCLDLDIFTWLFTGVAIESRFNPEKTTSLFRYKYGAEISIDVVKTLLECANRYV